MWNWIVENQETLNRLTRPAIMYLCGLCVAVGQFVPSCTADKLWVAAAGFGVGAVARTFDKRRAAPPQRKKTEEGVVS